VVVLNYLIGCDLGTTATKVGLFDEEGNLISFSRIKSDLIYGDDGSVTQGPYQMLKSVVGGIREVVEKGKVNTKDIAVICIDGQMAGILGVDKNGEPVTPYDSWLDVRCSPYVEIMTERAGDLILERSGMVPSINHGPKILWWRENHPEIYKKIFKFTVPSCWITQKLTGLSGEDTFLDYTYLHFSCFANLEEKSWDREILDVFELDENKLPNIVSPWNIVGKLKKEWAEMMLLVEGIPLSAGCGDQAANILGAGIVERGMVFDVAGTASCFSVLVDKFVPDIKHKTLLLPRSVIDGYYYPMAYINGGGLNLEWAREEFFKDITLDQFVAINQALEKVTNTNIVFIPHLKGRGCPNQPYLRGVFAGFSWEHKREHLFRAILEGIAFEYLYYLNIIKELFPDMSFSEVRVIGGGAKSKIWNTIKASVLNIPYVELDREECAIWGSAILGGYSIGLFDNLIEKAKNSVKIIKRCYPDENLHLLYQRLFPLYKDTLEVMAEVFLKHKDLLEH